MPEEIWKMPAVDLARAIKGRQLSSEEVVQAFLERIATHDPSTNAFAFVDAEQALDAARSADAAVRDGDELGLLHGVPVAVKDVIATRGMRTAYGSTLHADNVPDADAQVVVRVRKAGGILIGKTTTPEFAHKVLTDSPLHGITRNPWSLEHSPGGSSGGAAVAASMGFCSLNITTDGAGSSRIPAACCGVLGLKPTLGTFPNENSPDVFGMQVIGAITRSTADLHLLYHALVGSYAGDPFSLSARTGYNPVHAEPVLSRLRIRYFPRMGNHRVDDEVLQVTERALGMMVAAGARVVGGPDIDWRQDAWRVLLRAQQASRFRGTLSSIREELDPSLVACIEEGLGQNVIELQDALLARSDLYKQLAELFSSADIILSPVVAAPPLLVSHGAGQPLKIAGVEEGSLRQAWHSYTTPMNGSGHPAISIPCGYTAAGLPLGIQIAGPWHSEELLIRIASEFEAIQAWPQDWPTLVSSNRIAS